MSTKTAENLSLRWAQGEVFNAKERFRVLVAGRRFGKSYLSCIELLKAAIDRPGETYFYCAPTYRMAKDIAWKEIAGDPDEEGCWVWVEYYRRSLINQRPWPFCTCKYEWFLLERTCEVDSNAFAEAISEGPGIAEAFPDTALHDFIWAAGW